MASLDRHTQEQLKGEVKRRIEKIAPNAHIQMSKDTVQISNVDSTSTLLLDHLAFNAGWRKAVRKKFHRNPDVWFYKGQLFLQFVPEDRTTQLEAL